VEAFMAEPIPAGYHSVTPYLMVRDAARAMAFYRDAFGATEVMRFAGPDGRIAHAEVKIGDSHVMLADELPDQGFVGPQTLGGAGVSLMLYVNDVDATFAKALAAGATVRRPVADQFYGDRMGTLVDPYGHVWSIGTHREDVSVEEMQRRMASQQAS
jgi:PhnB protein